jgi:hypothetical protein
MEKKKAGGKAIGKLAKYQNGKAEYSKMAKE